MSYPSLTHDAHNIVTTLKRGGIAIIPTSVGYGIIASTAPALDRIFTTKRRSPDKRHAMIGTYTLHKEIHTSLPPSHAGLIHHLTVTQDLPLGVIAPYNPSHQLFRHPTLSDPVCRSMCTNIDCGGSTLAMLVNGGPLQEEVVSLATAQGMPVLGSSANLSGQGTKVRVEDIEPEIKEVADLVVDYGMRVFGVPRASSTMIDFRDVRVVRFGAAYGSIRDVVQRFGWVLPGDPGRDALRDGHLKGLALF